MKQNRTADTAAHAAGDAKPSIVVRNLQFRYPTRQNEILKNLNVDLGGGKLVCLLGANGAGKTTLFKLLLGHLPLQQGEIHVNGDALQGLSARELARRLAYIPQIQRYSFSYTVLDMVLMGTGASFSFWAQPGKEAYAMARSALRLLNMETYADRDFDRLSGGEQQMVLIARAVAQNTRILIMDEPCANLDYGNQMRVLRTVRGLADQGYLVLLSTHTPEHAMIFATEVLLMSGGCIEAHGSPETVMRAESLEKLYRIPLREFESNGGERSIIPDLKRWHGTDDDH